MRLVVVDWDEATKLTSSGVWTKPRGRGQASLVVLAGRQVGQTFPLDREETVLGRAPDCTVQLNGEGVSRRHARIVERGQGFHVEDLGSTNGTFVNGERVASRELADGDKLQIGESIVVKFTHHDAIDESFQRAMYESALRDGLTKTFNKQYFLDHLEAEFAYAQRHREPLSVLMFDLDHFKQVNDEYGHLAGDVVLQRVAEVVGASLRQEDVFARYGGEEFTILCRGTLPSDAQSLAERIRLIVAGLSIDTESASLTVTISIGIASVPDPSVADASDLLARTDRALYQAKRAGRNRVHVFAVEP